VALMNEEELSGIYGTLRKILHEQRSGVIRNIAGEAGFDLGMLPDGKTESGSGIQREPILTAMDGMWSTFPDDRKERTLRRFAEALAPEVGITNPPQDGAVERGIGLINERIRKHGFKIENGVFVPVD
jgi:hypothetical protein